MGERSGRSAERLIQTRDREPSSIRSVADLKEGETENLTHSESASPTITCPPLECPPCDCREPEPPPKKKSRQTPRPKASSPIDRQKLLAWVKRFSPRLKRCRDAGQAIYRLHAEVSLNAEKSKVLSSKVRGTDVPSAALRCVEADIKQWPAPNGLAESHPPKLIFSLQLN